MISAYDITPKTPVGWWGEDEIDDGREEILECFEGGARSTNAGGVLLPLPY